MRVFCLALAFGSLSCACGDIDPTEITPEGGESEQDELSEGNTARAVFSLKVNQKLDYILVITNTTEGEMTEINENEWYLCLTIPAGMVTFSITGYDIHKNRIFSLKIEDISIKAGQTWYSAHTLETIW